MVENNYQNKTNTSTQIRNMYSEGLSYLNIKFYNTNLSFQFSKFLTKDANGRNVYDIQNPLMTTVNYEGAYALYKASMDILLGKNGSQGLLLTIPCANSASLTLERKVGQNNNMETYFIINKNNTTISFKFNTCQINIRENGQMVTRIIETGLGMFAKTIEGYLTGINSDRHLDKLTDDYIKLKDPNNSSQQFKSNNKFNNYKKNWNNNQKKQWNNNQNSWETNQPNQQNMSTYQIKP